jgi:NADH-quinone oxidoreductase subunit N
MTVAQPPTLIVPGVSLLAIGPEMVLGVGGLGVLIWAAGFRSRRPHLVAAASLFVLAAAAGAALLGVGRQFLAFDDTVALDGFATFFKLVLVAVASVAVLASLHFLDAERAPAPEFYGLMILATAGMMLMASATDLILVFLALETFSLAFYVLAAYRRRLDSQEGSLKYFLTGSFSSAFFLYGVALIYGGTGTTRLVAIAEALSLGAVLDQTLLASGVALVLVGLSFKVAAVPFHMWTPDAYQGSPAPVSGFMAAGSKIAGFAVLLRVMVATFPSMASDWRPVVAALAVLTMAFGGVVAIAQANVKRMLAYSSIAHSGFLLVGVASANPRGISGSLFYLATYAITILGAFAVVYAVGRPGEDRVNLDGYRGLWSTQPFLAGILALLLISLAGVPPTAGFWAKFEIFSAAWDAGQPLLVVIGVLASAIAAFFYLRVIVLMFLEEPREWVGRSPPTAPGVGAALVAAAAVVVAFGVLPTPLIELARGSRLVFPGL